MKSVLIIDDQVQYSKALKEKLDVSDIIKKCDQHFDLNNLTQLPQEYDIYLIRLTSSTKKMISQLVERNKHVLLLTNDDTEDTQEEIKSLVVSDYIITDENSTGDYAAQVALRLLKNERLNVAVVDDSLVILTQLQILLEKQNLKVVTFNDGQKAWDYINDPNSKKLDLVITDYEMPNMDGYQLTKMIRTKYLLKDLPVLILSGTENKAMIAKFLKAGANDYIPKPFSQEEFVARITTVLNISEMFEQITDMAMTDYLTGLKNRNYFYEMGDHVLELSQRNKTPLSIAMIDIDDFKNVNDTYGHDIGDQALIHVTKILRKSIRRSDILVRFGGEEFVILFSNCPAKQACQLASSLCKLVAKQPLDIGEDKELLLTISIGISSIEGTLDEMIIEADSNMYKAKIAGKNQAYCGS